MKNLFYSIMIGSAIWLLLVYIFKDEINNVVQNARKDTLYYSFTDRYNPRYNPPDSAKIFPNYILEIYRGDTITVINLNFK